MRPFKLFLIAGVLSITPIFSYAQTSQEQMLQEQLKLLQSLYSSLTTTTPSTECVNIEGQTPCPTATTSSVFDFNISTSGGLIKEVAQGDSVVAGILVTPMIGKVTPVFFTLESGLPDGVTYSFSPTIWCAPPCSQNLVIRTSANAKPGNYTIVVQGKGGGFTSYDKPGEARRTQFTLVIKGSGDLPSGATSAKFRKGDRVCSTVNLKVRSLPSVSASASDPEHTYQLSGSCGTIIDGPVFAEGYWWWKIDWGSGPDGWSVENYLMKSALQGQALSGTGTTTVGSGTTSGGTKVSQKLKQGDRVRVTRDLTGESINLSVRANASISQPKLGTQKSGTLGTITGGPIAQGGFVWWKINYDSGADGWSVETYLEKVTSITPTPPLPPPPFPTPTEPPPPPPSATSTIPTVSLTVNQATVTVGQPFSLIITGASSVGLASVWWWIEDTASTTFHNIPGTVDGVTVNLAAAQGFGSGAGLKYYTKTHTVTVNEPGIYIFSANSRDILYPVPGEPHQASEGAGIASVMLKVLAVTTPPPSTASSSITILSPNGGTYTVEQNIPVKWQTSGQISFDRVYLYHLGINSSGSWVPTYGVGSSPVQYGSYDSFNASGPDVGSNNKLRISNDPNEIPGLCLGYLQNPNGDCPLSIRPSMRIFDDSDTPHTVLSPPAYNVNFSANPVKINSGEIVYFTISGTSIRDYHFTLKCPSGMSAPANEGELCNFVQTFSPSVTSYAIKLINSTSAPQIVTAVLEAINNSGVLIDTRKIDITVIPAVSTPPPPADTTAPAVSVSSPVAGTLVSGTQTISTTASDATGVVKVEFYVDGALKGTDTSSPYSYSWDTTNGGAHPCSGSHTHTLTAKAHDAAGNIGTSAGVTVNMNNPSYCSAKFSVGDRVQVTDGPLNVRSSPSTSASSLGTQAIGVLGTVVSGPTYANGFNWWQINFDSGVDGWSVENFMAKLTPAPVSSTGATLSLSPSSHTLKTGEQATVNVLLNTNGKAIGGVDLYLTYNPTLIRVEDSDASASGVQITPGTLMPVNVSNSVVNGQIQMSQVTAGSNTYTGQGILASLRITALAAGTANLNFKFTLGSGADTNVASAGQDVLVQVVNGVYIVQAP